MRGHARGFAGPAALSALALLAVFIGISSLLATIDRERARAERAEERAHLCAASVERAIEVVRMCRDHLMAEDEVCACWAPPVGGAQ